MSSSSSPIQPSTTSTNTTTHSKATTPQSSGLVNLPSEILVKILEMLSIREFGSMNRTCHQISWVTTNDAPFHLLTHFFPNFRKTDPNQTYLEALKEGHITNSNLAKGVYVSHILEENNMIQGPLASDGQRLIFSSRDYSIKVWDLNTNTCTATLQGHRGPVRRLAVDGQRLFSGSNDKTIKIWDLTTNTCIATLQGHSDEIGGLAVDGQRLISGSYDKTIKIWDLTTKTCTSTLQDDGYVTEIYLNEQTLFSGSSNPTIKIWDLNTNTCTAILQGHNATVLSFALKGQRLFSASYDHTIKIWDLTTNTCIATLQGHNDSVYSLALDGQRLFSGSRDDTIKIWDLNTNTCTATLKGGTENLIDLAFHGQRLFSTHQSSGVKVWDFSAPHRAVFEKIADLLTSEDATVRQDAINRFNRMPTTAKNAIYGELYRIIQPFAKDYFGCAEHAFHNQYGQSSTPKQKAQAILNYLNKKS
ncbi:MAG: WD40 repeat domain-containing protein [Verrucomicrobia bacterium]|nr:WD40 repeat domain-containing protein [Verrucomicrobiota bacterium]